MRPTATDGEPDDRGLVLAAQRGDALAFRKLVERYQRRIVQLALSMVKDPDEAMDIAQETFVRVHRYLPSFKGDSSFFTWTFRIATNLCVDAARKKARSVRVGLPVAPGGIGEELETELAAGMDPLSAALVGPLRAAENRELREKLGAALEQLSEDHRAIVLLREVDGLSYEELSEVLGIPKGTVMSRLFHARMRLQAMLRDEDDRGRAPPHAAGEADS
jgi:RNA polymerase sigma-70 factor (ECF subfamily)